MFIHFLYLCPLRLSIMLNFNISKVPYLLIPIERILKLKIKPSRDSHFEFRRSHSFSSLWLPSC